MSSKLINTLIKNTKPERDVLNKTVDNNRDEHIKELKSLYQIPMKEKLNDMPHFQVFKEGLHQADLLMLPMDNKYNYALVVVDIHSRKCDAEPITTKSADSVVKAFQKIYNRKILKLPIEITFDNGKEFKGETKQYFKEQDINIRYAETNRHRQVAMAEAKNKTIGSTLHKLMALVELKTKKESRQWVKYLPEVVSAINKSLPEPITKELKDEPFSSKSNEDILPIGTRVRVKLDYPINLVNKKRLVGTFRSSDIRWTRDIKTITNIILKPGFPIMYQVNGESFSRTRNEIQVVETIEYF